ncbi:Hypothetical predicted protein, partial [Mytilus galloprovincialis]
MATNQPQNLLEWQLHCVLKRSNLLQYYERFIKQGECDVIKLSKAEDGKFQDIMEKVGMAKKSFHVRLFKNTLLEWAKDPEKNKNVPSSIKKSDDSKISVASLPAKSSMVPQFQTSLLESKTTDKEERTRN